MVDSNSPIRNDGGDIPNVIQAVSPSDVMYRSSPEYYFRLGRQAMETIQGSVALVGLSKIERILDMPSGHGRVLRFLRATYPHARIDACDIDVDAVDFCARTFDARPVYSTPNLAAVPLTESYDLIWCGSLLTHVHADQWRAVLELFGEHLREGGLMISTTHGRYHAGRLRSKETKRGLSDWAVKAVLSDYDRFGFGFQNYSGQEGYGISLSSAPWVCAQIVGTKGLRLAGYQERGWADHQDVVVGIKDSREATYPH